MSLISDHSRLRFLLLQVIILVISLVSESKAQQPAGWFNVSGSSTMRSGKPAGFAKSAGIPSATSAGAVAPSASFAPLSITPVIPEIQSLADSLGNDPLAIFNWVRNNIQYKHYRGAKKGALVTLVEGTGNDYDQSLLLRDLLVASGKVAKLRYGLQNIPYVNSATNVDIRHWLGLPEAAFSNNHADDVILLGGTLPTEASADASYVYLKRVWVQLQDGAIKWELDPSFKKLEQVQGIDLAAASDYVQASALGSLGGFPDDGGRSIRGATESVFATHLQARTTTLLQRLSLPANAFRKPLEVTGGWRMKNWEATSLAEAFPISVVTDTVTVDLDPLPADRVATLRLRVWDGPANTLPANGQYSIDMTLALPDLAGRRLTLEFDKDVAGDTKAKIFLDDTETGAEATFVAGTTTNLQIYIDHPTNGNQLDQEFQQSYKRKVTANGMPNGTAIYALVHGFDVSRESLRRRERVLEGYKTAGKADKSREIIGETLNVIGQQWYLQTQLVADVLANMTGCTQLLHHRIGRVSQEEGVYIDVMGQQSGTLSRTAASLDKDAAFTTSSFYWSAMEDGVLDQLQNISAASTVGLISRANALDHKIFVARNLSDYIAIEPQIPSYSQAQKDELKKIWTVVGGSGTSVFPSNADLRMSSDDTWRGVGYVLSTSIVSPTGTASGIGMIISGGYNGGYSTKNWSTQSTPVYQSTYSAPAKITPTPPAVPRLKSYDPVDLATGHFLVEGPPDLAVGSSLALVRSYDGARRTQDIAGAGYGWTHSGHLLLSERTSVESALGLRSASDMAATLVSAVAVLDLYRTRDIGTEYAKKWLGSLLAAKWAVSQLKNNSVTVQLPDKTMEFIRQPDATFTAPTGMPVVLAKNTAANVYTVTPRHGSTTTFEASVPAVTGQYRIKQTTDLWNRTQSYTYDATSGKLAGISDPFGRTLTLAYTNGRLSGLSDSTGRSVSYGYDTNGDLTTFTDSEGKNDSFVYDGLHRITETKDNTGRVIVENFYDERSRVVKQHNQGLSARSYLYSYGPGVTREKDPTGAATLHLFDDRSRTIGSINALGQRQIIGYDARDHQVTQTTPLGRTTTSVYDTNDTLRSTTDPTGAITQYGYDSQFRLNSITDPLNRVTGMTQNAKHQVLTTTNPLLEPTTNVYDPVTGYLTSTTNHVGHTTSYLYDTYGQMERTTFPDTTFIEQSSSPRGDVNWTKDARGIQTTFTYNKRREQNSATQGGRVVKTEYDHNRNPWRSVNARGFSTTGTFSATAKPLTTTAPDGATLTTGYDLRDQPQNTTGPQGQFSQVIYDPLSRPQTSIDPLNRPVTTVYDADGMVSQVQAPLSRTSQTSYQIGVGLPRKVTSTNALTHTTVTEHDAAGQKRFVTNRNAKVYEMTYDALGRTKQTIQPGGRTLGVVYAWNATGRTETLTEPSGQVTTLQYDKLGRLKTRTGPDSTTSYGYDPSGNLLTVTEGAAVLTRTYEPTRDMVSTYTNAAGDVIGYTYDANGNLSTLTYPGGKTVTYGYDTNDRMVKVTDWSGRITKMGYDLSGRLTSIKRPNGTTRRMTYDAAGQMTSFTEVRPRGELIASQSWRYDAGGRPEKRFRSPGATAFTPPSYTATYHPDNRMNTVTPGGGSSATVVSDLDGNMTSVPLWEPSRAWAATVPSWDARNRLTGISTANATATYAYDAEGNLVSRTQSGQTTRYSVDPSGAMSQQLIEHRPDGSKTFYVYGPGLLYEESFNAAGTSLATRSYHYDQVGSTIALSDSTGTVTGRLEYTAYGVTSYTSGMVDTKFRYNGVAGVQTDLGTGLLQMRARWYSPSLGRFLSEDPIGFSGGSNWFAYADGNPISLSDPFGLFPSTAWWGGFLDFDQGTVDALGVGAMATTDGFIPFADPFQNSGSYDPNQDGVGFSQAAGGIARDAALAAVIPNIGAWAKNPVMYELGSTTVPTTVYQGISHLSTAQKGVALVEMNGGGLGGIARTALGTSWKYVGENLATTVGTGLTPGGYLSLDVGLHALDSYTNKSQTGSCNK